MPTMPMQYVTTSWSQIASGASASTTVNVANDGTILVYAGPSEPVASSNDGHRIGRHCPTTSIALGVTRTADKVWAKSLQPQIVASVSVVTS